MPVLFFDYYLMTNSSFFSNILDFIPVVQLQVRVLEPQLLQQRDLLLRRNLREVFIPFLLLHVALRRVLVHAQNLHAAERGVGTGKLDLGPEELFVYAVFGLDFAYDLIVEVNGGEFDLLLPGEGGVLFEFLGPEVVVKANLDILFVVFRRKNLEKNMSIF